MTMRRSTWMVVLGWSALALPSCEVGKQLGEQSDASSGETATGSPTDSGSVTDIDPHDAAALMADAACDAMLECCFADGGVTHDQCYGQIIAFLDAQIGFGLSSELTYDPACVQAFVDTYSVPGCLPAESATMQAREELARCDLFYGSALAGEACQAAASELRIPRSDTCAQGLQCVANVCVAPKQLGDPCGTANAFEHDCPYGAFCDPTVWPPVCTPNRAIGASCSHTQPCVDGASCDLGVCVAVSAVGQPCGASGCGFASCDASQTCVEQAGYCYAEAIYANTCADTQSDTATFIEGNDACESPDDCVVVDAACYSDATCGQIALSAGHDPDNWAWISGNMALCMPCATEGCDVTPSCVDNHCVLSEQ